MKLSFYIIVFLSLICVSASAQFNNVYFNSQLEAGTCLGIKENLFTGDYIIPSLYTIPQGSSNNLGFLRISSAGVLNELKYASAPPQDYYYGNGGGFFRTLNNDFILAGRLDSLFLMKLDSDLDTIWSVKEYTDNIVHFWGGGELSNGDLALGLYMEDQPYNVMKMRRYSSNGELISTFDVTLDYDFSYPSSFVTRDSLIYISFPRHLNNNYRRNYIVCYNAITGEEIWESHQIENEVALGYTDGFLTLSPQGKLSFVFIEQTELDFPNVFMTYYDGFIKVINLDAQTGSFLETIFLSELESAVSIVDIASTNDEGLILLINTPAQNPYHSIMKVSETMEVEWRFNYSNPIPLEPFEEGSFLIEIEATSDDCILSVGSAILNYFETQVSFQYPWVLKVDACGNEMVSDCALSGVGEISGTDKISIYPNPARDRIYLKGKNTIKHVSIYDLQGKMVHDESFSGSLEQTLFVDHLTPGLYLVSATNEKGEVLTQKVMISN